MKSLLLPLLLLSSLSLAQDDTVSVPKSMLTDQQKAQLKIQDARSYVGLGKEIGDAVNSSLQAISTQSNAFAQTPVGKLTACLVIWKVIGDEAVHIFGGLVELIVFLPIWIWSYRRSCLTRRYKIGKDQWKVVEYDYDHIEFTPRIAHALIAGALITVVLFTVFSY